MLLLGVVACTSQPETPSAPAEVPPVGGRSSAAIPAVPSEGSAGSTAPVASSSSRPTAAASTPDDPAGPQPIDKSRALTLIFGTTRSDEAQTCMPQQNAAAIRCLLALRFAGDAKAREIVLGLFDREGIVTGVEREYTMDGGWRGMVHLVPELPVGRYRRHLVWIASAVDDFREFFGGLQGDRSDEFGYRFQPIELKFFRSVNRTTPSAYASDWSMGFNVSGSLHRSADAVRETLFHEVFHLNDRAHGHWSATALAPHFDAIVTKCTRGGRLSTPCLTPFAPADTMVRGGTYYAFQPGNGVGEYAAELSIRYYREHRAVLAKRPLRKRAFKCGPDPNPLTWELLVDEFFAGIDLVPAC